jgi:hypothetical protein
MSTYYYALIDTVYQFCAARAQAARPIGFESGRSSLLCAFRLQTSRGRSPMERSHGVEQSRLGMKYT